MRTDVTIIFIYLLIIIGVIQSVNISITKKLDSIAASQKEIKEIIELLKNPPPTSNEKKRGTMILGSGGGGQMGSEGTFIPGKGAGHPGTPGLTQPPKVFYWRQ